MIRSHLLRSSRSRRAVGGMLMFVSLAAGTIGMANTVAADTTAGYISIGARICPFPTSNPVDDCSVSNIGSLSLGETGAGSTVLTMNTAYYAGDNLAWSDVPVTDYALETIDMDVPSGFQIADFVAVEGDAGYSGSGYYVSLTDAAPSVEAYIVYRPSAGKDTDGDGLNDAAEITIGTDPNVSDLPDFGPDADGDGASDEDEIAWGSDPNDASDFPNVQAGPDNTDTDGDGKSDEDEIASGSDPEDASDFGEVMAGPEDTDTDGDGKSDEDEIASGSDPEDASDFGEIMAGPDADSEGDAVVTSLPNTGFAGTGDDANSANDLFSIMLATGGLIAVGGVTVLRKRAS